MKNKFILLLAAMLIIMSMGLIFAVEEPPTDGEKIFEVIFDKFGILTDDDSVTPFVAVASALESQKSFIKSEIISEFAKTEDGIILLKDYNFTEANIINILNEIVNEKGLILDLAIDEDISYPEYKDEIKALVMNIYSNVPEEFKTELNNFGEDEVLVFKTLLVTVLNDTIAYQVKNTKTLEYSAKAFVLDTDTRTKLYLELVKMNDSDLEKCQDLAGSFYALGDVTLNILEKSLLEAEDLGSNSMFDLAFELVKKADMVKTSLYTPTTPVTPTTVVVTPASGLDEDDDAAVEELESLVPATDEATEDQQVEIQDKVTDVMESIGEDAATAENADEQVRSLNETLNNVVDALDSDKAAEVVSELTELTNNVLDNINVNAEEAQEMVNELIETTFKTLVAKEDVSDETQNSIEEDVLKLVQNVIKKAGNVQMAAQVSEGDTAKFEVSETSVTDAITNAIEAKEELVTTLNDSGLSDVGKDVEQNVNIKLPEVDEGEVSLELSADSISALGENNVGLTVEAEGVNFKLPAELMATMKTGITIETKPVVEKLSTNAQNGTAKELKTMDLTVGSNGESIKGLVELSFSIEDLENVDLDTLMVGVYEDGKWVKLNYEIRDGRIIFTAPHFSIYSLMTFESKFADIKDDWANKYIKSLTAKGIISGRSDEVFNPQGIITRAEFTTLLVKYLKLNDEVKTNYKDVLENSWYYDVVARAGMNGITAGVANGNFRPDEAITREEMVVMLFKAFNLKNGFDLSGDASVFVDESEISDYAFNAVYAAKANGIISGYADNTFKPLSNATRAEAATMMYLFINK